MLGKHARLCFECVPDLAGFQSINPCSIVGCIMTSLQKILGRSVALVEVKECTRGHFERLLDQWLPMAATDIE